MKRVLSLLAAAALLLLPVSCGKPDSGAPVAVPAATETTAAPETADPLLPADVKDLGGRTYHLLYPTSRNYIAAEEQNGNGLNDALYRRDQETEDALNVDIVLAKVSAIGDVFPAVQAAVAAGDAAYDFVVNHVNSNLVRYASDNVAADWNTVPHVDFTKPYWHADIIDSLSVNGKAPYACSDICIIETVIMLSNKKLASDLHLGSLYDLVYEGKWTWDKLAELSGAVRADINGDTVYDEKDRYGIVINCSSSQWMLRDIPSSCGLFIYKNDAKGLELTVGEEKTGDVLKKITALFNGGGGYVFKEKGTDLKYSAELFGQGNYLTYFVPSISAPATFNDLPFDYGILPLPKYDEAQEKYLTLSWANNLIIPVNADKDVSGLVSEWMSYFGYQFLRPVFYDSLLSTRFAQDTESMDMLDIIFSNLVFDPGINFKSKNFYSYFDDLVIANNSDFASFYASSLTSEESYLKSLNDSFTAFGK